MGEWLFTQKETKSMKAYLSGAMEFANDEGAGWRKEMTQWLSKNLGHTVYNPVIESEDLVKEYGAESYREWKINDISPGFACCRPYSRSPVIPRRLSHSWDPADKASRSPTNGRRPP